MAELDNTFIIIIALFVLILLVTIIYKSGLNLKRDMGDIFLIVSKILSVYFYIRLGLDLEIYVSSKSSPWLNLSVILLPVFLWISGVVILVSFVSNNKRVAALSAILCFMAIGSMCYYYTMLGSIFPAKFIFSSFKIYRRLNFKERKALLLKCLRVALKAARTDFYRNYRSKNLFELRLFIASTLEIDSQLSAGLIVNLLHWTMVIMDFKMNSIEQDMQTFANKFIKELIYVYYRVFFGPVKTEIINSWIMWLIETIFVEILPMLLMMYFHQNINVLVNQAFDWVVVIIQWIFS